MAKPPASHLSVLDATAAAIAPSTAALLSVFFTLLYVLPFYLSPQTRPSPTLTRDAPSSIRARVRAVTVSCLVSTAITVYVLVRHGSGSTNEEALDLASLLRLLGWWPVGLKAVGKTVVLLCILFAGPLFEAGWVEGGWREWIRGGDVVAVVGSWVGWRNYVVGPISEELIWRSLLISLHLATHALTPTRIIFTTPLYFGIAHIHHCYEFKLTHPSTPLLPVLLRSLFQFTYTSLFGFFAAYLFLRTGSVWPPVVAHVFCNWMGLPRVWGWVGEEVCFVEAGGDGRTVRAVGRSVVRLWTGVYYVLLVGGAVGFWMSLGALTGSENALVDV